MEGFPPGRRATMTTTLDDLMTFGNIVYSDGNGNVTDEFDDTMYGPDTVTVELDSDGQLTGDPVDMAGYGDWELLTGYTTQESRFMPEIMHSSEYVGGKLETRIREVAGYYVTVMVDASGLDVNGETVAVGWAVAYQES